MDSLIYLLVKVVLPEYESQDRVAHYNVGRMTPQRRKELERENSALAISLGDALTMVSIFDEISNSFEVIMVQHFKLYILYDITFENSII